MAEFQEFLEKQHSISRLFALKPPNARLTSFLTPVGGISHWILELKVELGSLAGRHFHLQTLAFSPFQCDSVELWAGGCFQSR